jgi:hypothetical protein
MTVEELERWEVPYISDGYSGNQGEGEASDPL